ncbi:hypothetical protein [Microcoleus sp.]|uniref:hypothetical protein n=1 Tax=Microcoleus sp. TaxID=44472 RepID=UPI0035254840
MTVLTFGIDRKGGYQTPIPRSPVLNKLKLFSINTIVKLSMLVERESLKTLLYKVFTIVKKDVYKA